MNYLLHLLIYLSIYAIVAMSLNMVVGYCGLLSLAQAGYFAVGSYTYALTTLTLGWDFVPALLLGVALASTLSVALSLSAWRFKGDAFVMISLSVQALLFSLFYNWSSIGKEPGTLANLTNGPFGIAAIPKPSLFHFKADSLPSIALLSLCMAVLCSLFCWRLLLSPWGRLLKAMRDDELALRSLGKNVRLAKLQVFAISCGMAAIAGTLYASYVSYVDPGVASLNDSILMLCMVLVGGVANLKGPLVGALILLAIPELLRFADIPNTLAANVRLMLYGAALVLMMHFRPQGIAGEYRVE
jgi:branched-chain amino acid transport system permease protein